MVYDTTKLDKRDINRIINSLRLTYGPKLFGDCSKLFEPGINEAKLFPIELFRSKNSRSPTDIIFSAAEIGRQEPFKTAMKMWFNWNTYEDHEIEKIFNKACTRNGTQRCNTTNQYDILKKMFMDAGYVFSSEVENAYRSMVETLMARTTYQALEYEARVYSYITENIIVRNVSPNFIPLYSANSCNINQMITAIETSGSLKPEDKEQILKKLRFLRDATADTGLLRMQFIITGSAAFNDTLRSFLEKGAGLATTDVAGLVFQILYTLYVLDAYEITHNDLHLDNLFVQTLTKKQKMQFDINGKKVVLDTKYILKLYDYDASQVQLLGKNPANNGLYYVGRTDGFRKGIDFSQLMCGISKYSDNIPVLKEIMNSIGLYTTARKMWDTRPSIRGNRILMPPVVDFYKFLSGKLPYQIDNTITYEKFYRISLYELSKFPEVQRFCKTVFPDFDVIKTFVFAVDGTDIYIYERWDCVGTNDYSFENIQRMFEKDKLDILSRYLHDSSADALILSPDTRIPLRYTFIKPVIKDLVIPADTIGDIYPMIVEENQAKRGKKKYDDEDIDSDVAPVVAEPAKRFAPERNEPIVEEQKEPIAPYRPLYTGPFGRGWSDGWSPY
jgi:hypothetical protein